MRYACEGRATPGGIAPKRLQRLWTLLGILAGPAVGFPATGQGQLRPGEPIRPIELEGFVVTGAPFPRPLGAATSHVTILTGEELRSRGVSRVVDALREIPGMVVVQMGSWGGVTSVFLRGAESDHMKVLVDGVEVNQVGGAYDLSGLLTADVERIEVVRGPASAMYGSDAMAGVVHVITRRGKGAPRTSLDLRAGGYGRREASLGLSGGDAVFAYSLSAAQAAADGILPFNNRFRSTGLSGTASFLPDPGTRVEVTGRLGERVFHFPTDGAGNLVDRNAYTFGKENLISLEAERVLGPWFRFQVAFRGYGWNGGTDDAPDSPSDTLGVYAFSSLDALQRKSLDLRTHWTVAPRLLVSFGTEWDEVDQRSVSESRSQWGPSFSTTHLGRMNRGYYAHLLGAGPQVAGHLGARWEDDERYGSFFTWQAGLSFQASEKVGRIRLNAGKGMKEPTFFETANTAYTVGNPDLRPEQSQVWETGVERAILDGRGKVSLSWFHQELRDLIQYTFSPPSPGAPNYYNVAKARSRGVEFTGQATLGGTAISGAYTLLDTEVLDAGFDEGVGAIFVKGEPLIRRPRHQAGFSLSGGFGRVRWHGDLRWVGERKDRDFGTWPASPVTLESYSVVGAGLEIPLRAGGKGGWEGGLTLKVENLLDAGYEESKGFAAPGRVLLVGVRLQEAGGRR